MTDKVDDIFSRIADRYDTTNRIISLGTDLWVRRKAVEIADPAAGESVLDCAAGTGDLTFMFREAVGSEGRVVGSDVNADMLELARRKADDRGVTDIDWDREDAQQLPYPDDTFDIVAIAYGIRNVEDPVAALESMARVTKPGGRVVILEFGRPPAPLKPLYWTYNRVVIPVVGGLVSGEPEAYRYLQRTSDAFPSGDEFVDMMRATDAFDAIEAHAFMTGINYVYRGDVG